MPEFVTSHREVSKVFCMGMHLDRNAFYHGQTVAFQSYNLLGVISKQFDLTDTEVANLRADATVPKMSLKTEGKIRLNGILARVLEFVRL